MPLALVLQRTKQTEHFYYDLMGLEPRDTDARTTLIAWKGRKQMKGISVNIQTAFRTKDSYLWESV